MDHSHMHHDHSKMHSAAGGEASGHAGHAGHDHGGHGGHSGHSMSFHFSTQSTILFDWWTTSNPTEMFFACIIVFGAAYLFEWLAEYRRSMDRDLARAKTKEPKGAAPALVSDDMQLRRSASYALSMLISYLLMLCSMTYNGFLFASLIAGFGFGHYVHNRRIAGANEENEEGGSCH